MARWRRECAKSCLNCFDTVGSARLGEIDACFAGMHL
jgi:hypothetical protein